jgi:hypothetical protein
MPISGLRISDVIASSKIGLKASNTIALELHNVQVNADSGVAFFVWNSTELELDGVATRKPSLEAPLIRLDNCPGTIIRNCHALAGTGTFLSVAPGELKNVILEGNVINTAHQASEESAAFYLRSRERPTEGD